MLTTLMNWVNMWVCFGGELLSAVIHEAALILYEMSNVGEGSSGFPYLLVALIPGQID